ncbi:MAG: SUMF1/EgtB/PvdO family nonheme iron enzyme [Nostoc sp.]|uniref:SUMF1/EgtB/PvdO family nonheme iron enzyme n=1 Tax=Nostoc sp. TaxID=1180 RepID=UPI002FF7931B
MTDLADAEQLREQAKQAVDRFVRRFDESYRLLAYHAALPLVLTPELVNYLRNEFLRGEQVPWVAEVDLLLSDLCSQVGYELYTMETYVREYLLEQMQQNPRFGKRRMQEVAQVLYSYVNYLSRLNPGRRQQEIEAQGWAAMVYLGDEQCKKAVGEIVQRLIETNSGAGKATRTESGIRAELARLTRITEELSPQLKQEPILLDYARFVQRVLRTPEQVSVAELGSSFQVGDFELKFPDRLLPEELARTLTSSRQIVPNLEGFPPIQTFEFKIATVLESEFEICTFQVATIEKSLNTVKNIKWLFQASSKSYRLLDAIRDLEEVFWPIKIKSYAEEIAIEDGFVIWFSGKKSGIYAIAKIIELKELQEAPDIDYWIDKNVFNSGQNKPKARLHFVTKLLDKPLLKETIKQDEILKDLLVIRNPRLTISKLKSEESERIYDLIQELETIIKTETKEAEFYTEKLGDSVELEMLKIPDGYFTMGAPENEEDSNNDERPQHQVIVPAFFMGKYPVTQAEWREVAVLPQVNRELDPDPSNFKSANRPVEQVCWYDAVEFCDRLSQYTGKSYRLPSEAEWEYACRAGTTTPFHFGETITSELANYRATETYGAGVKGTYREETTPVGSFGVANAFGLYDMHGNVWEWCLDDSHSSYEGAPTDGSPWFHSKNDNLYQKQGSSVLRGGSWYDDPRSCRSAYRYNVSTRVNHFNAFGFRIVCAAGRIL